MCGIVGINSNEKSKILDSLDLMKHRGPDDIGFFTDRMISLGQVRLSILDLSSAGKQPMIYEHRGKKVVIVHNGEIYNFTEIKKELEAKNYNFNSRTDTEVILASYIDSGTDCVKKFNGMWAFCIYDIEKQILFLSRDRLGQKPLYYYWNGKNFIFSSELKGILNFNIPKIINQDGLDLYFSLGMIPAPYSIFKNVYKLEPRKSLIFDIKKKKITELSYYKLPKYQPDRNLGILIDEGKKLLKDATKLRLIADVPIGAFLSGGLDSSATVATMSNFLELKNLNTFSIGFSGSYDETKYSSIIKDFFNTKHHYKFFNKNDFEKLLNTIFYFYDEPFADHSIFPTIAVSKLASDFVKVVLTGDGGDEIFGGYDKYQAAAQIAILRKMPKLVRKLGYRLIPKSIESSISTFRYLKEGIKISLKPPEDYFTELWSEEVYKPEIYKQWTQMKLKHCLDLSNGNFTEALIKYDYYFSTMAENFLLKVDRASMAHSVETRSPFLDYRFIDYSTKIPVEMKTNYKKRKILMREIIKDLVPEEIVKRGKKGFEPPIIEWIMKEKYLTEIKRRIDELHNREILNDNWKDFYDRIYVKKKKSLIDTWYLVRMFLFGRWVDQWFSKT